MDDMIKKLSASKKIAIFGWPATGKSTFGKWISSKLDIELYALDVIRWKYSQNGIKDHEKFLEAYEEILKKEEWIIEGNALDWIDSRLEQSDILLFFDSTVERTIERYYQREERIALGMEERMNCDSKESAKEFAFWLKNRYVKKIEKLKPMLDQYKEKIMIINHYEELDELMKKLNQ